LGGTRFLNYASESEAIIDVLRLSQGMTYKAAIAGLNLGGGKSVIIGDSRTNERERVFRAHGRAVESLKGRYITAEDVGSSVDDMEFVRMETDAVVGVHGASGDPSPITAIGVYRGMRACAAFRYGDDRLDGKHVIVQGAGHVGYNLCKRLAADGAQVTVADIEEDRVQRVVDDYGASAVTSDEVYGLDADIFAPCALGAVINDDSLKVFSVDIIAGAANNQLAEARHGQAVHDRGILYAPDYVINAGGLYNVYGEIQGWTPAQSVEKVGEIQETLLRIFRQADMDDVPTSETADRLARERIAEAKKQRT